MKLSSLIAREQELVIRVGDAPEDTVCVWYRPGALTLEVADKVKEIVASGFEHDVALAMLEPLLVRWDLVEDDGVTEIPVNKDTLRKVPLELLGRILSAIEGDARPRPTKGEISEEPSPQTEESGPSRTGTSLISPLEDGESHPGKSSQDLLAG